MRNWQGITAVILACGITSTVILLIVVEFVPHHGHVSESEAAALSTALGAAIGAVATYLGTHHNEQPQQRRLDTVTDNPEKPGEPTQEYDTLGESDADPEAPLTGNDPDVDRESPDVDPYYSEPPEDDDR